VCRRETTMAITSDAVSSAGERAPVVTSAPMCRMFAPKQTPPGSKIIRKRGGVRGLTLMPCCALRNEDVGRRKGTSGQTYFLECWQLLLSVTHPVGKPKGTINLAFRDWPMGQAEPTNNHTANRRVCAASSAGMACARLFRVIASLERLVLHNTPSQMKRRISLGRIRFSLVLHST
jgi:hypothetical protein